MGKSLSQEKLRELDFLYKLTITIARFMDKPSDFKIFLGSANKLYNRKDSIAIRGFKVSLDDRCEDTQEFLSAKERKELNAILQKELGVTLDQIEHKRLEKIRRVVERGKIKSSNEYRLILSRVEEIYADDSKGKEVDQLNQLLRHFDRTHEPKDE